MTSDGGGLLLREANCCLGDLMARLGQCVSDFRQQGSVEHTATDLIAQRVCALALGYEDLNDHGTLRRDSLLALLAGRKDLTGQGRKRKRDRAAPLASAATLKRFDQVLSDLALARLIRRHRSVGKHEPGNTSGR